MISKMRWGFIKKVGVGILNFRWGFPYRGGGWVFEVGVIPPLDTMLNPQMGGAVDLFDFYKKTVIRILFKMSFNVTQMLQNM